ncbi:hypothetical protein [Telmatospirillum sp.]|uniref:hypothetical protein n=1 Tax=Telmatospirillum sp. TaxID=2079197 RepID=UPI002846DF89|nr:hypothetical protein [Telmatospirillum sp.]MDR3436552.1 hypothetical protein [Telmatospirillum sp.]
MESVNLDEINPEEEALFRIFSEKAVGTNINPQTLLATDYLNHFNEIVMMLEMIPDMPDCLEDAQAWSPKSYQDHFRDSQFRDKELAVEAYDHVPLRFRQPFEDVIGQMNAVITLAVDKIAGLIAGGGGQDGELREVCSESSRALQKMMDVASAIIHGSESRFDQSEIDGLLSR